MLLLLLIACNPVRPACDRFVSAHDACSIAYTGDADAMLGGDWCDTYDDINDPDLANYFDCATALIEGSDCADNPLGQVDDAWQSCDVYGYDVANGVSF